MFRFVRQCHCVSSLGLITAHLPPAPAPPSRLDAPSGPGLPDAEHPRLASLTGLRFLAAALVVGVHVIFYTRDHVRDALSSVAGQGQLGVQFFFLLSGFVLTWSQRSVDAPRSFARRRFARIYPTYLVALLAGVAVTAYEGGASPVPVVISCLLLVQAWFPYDSYYFGVNGVSWSLSAEAFFYACFPSVISLLDRARGRQPQLLALLLAAELGTEGWAHLSVSRSAGTGAWLTYIFPAKRLLEFLIGMVVARLLELGRLPWISFRWALGASALACIAAQATSTAAGAEVWGVLPFVALIVAAAQRDLSGRGTPFSSALAIRLGEASFSLYLVHQLVLRTASEAVGHKVFASFAGVPALLFLTVTSVISLAAALALHYGVERPAERWLRGDRRLSAGNKDRGVDPTRRRPPWPRRRPGVRPKLSPVGAESGRRLAPRSRALER